MEFTVSKAELVRELSLSQGVVEKKTTIPILSNVLLEAMAAKLPIAATKAGGNTEIMVHNETGLLVPFGDSPGLASAIAQLLGDPDLASRFAEAAFARVTREFSAEHYRRRLLGFYAEALNTGSAGAG